jgi:hypothetical protein
LTSDGRATDHQRQPAIPAGCWVVAANLREVVEWPVLDKYAEEIRNALHADAVVRSIW